jgi:hypothetical protein
VRRASIIPRMLPFFLDNINGSGFMLNIGTGLMIQNATGLSIVFFKIKFLSF